MNFKCPICGKAIPSFTTTSDGQKQVNAPFFPFCSERCRLVDLGTWLDGGYRVEVPAEQAFQESAEDDTEH